MGFIVFCFILSALGANCAPVEDAEAKGEESLVQNEAEEAEIENSRVAKEENFQARDDEKNPVQEWFENVSKNVSTNTQNTMNGIKDWFNTLAQNSNSNPPVQNLPTMYMGSFQLLKMPMPQISDVIKGMGDLATLAQTFNKVTGGGGLPQLAQGLPQGIPLISQG